MKTFKEQVAADFAAVFINESEFADKHIFNDVSCLAVVQDINTKENLSIDKSGEYYPGAYGARKQVNIIADVLPEIPVYGQTVKLDGKYYEVESCDNDMGMLTIILMANRS
nr:MAG TPA_asm: Gifsy-2 prophage ATP-binding sugar transporter-like barrel, 4 helix bundle.7A [Caudoviricetes sp.]